MIVLCVTDCPPKLRGDLSKWLSEVNTGVYVGRLSARVREELWERVCDNIKNGQAAMVFSTNNEQGYVFLTHNTTWVPIDYEGITLMRRPLAFHDEEERSPFLQRGFSKAAKYEKMKHLQHSREADGYVIMDVEATGLDYKNDRIIEVGLLRIKGGEVEQELQCLVQTDKAIPDNVAKLTGITNEILREQGLSEETVFDMVQRFIGDDIVVGYDVQRCVDFLQRLAERNGKTMVIRKVRDILRIAQRKLDDLEDYELGTMAVFFSLDAKPVHRALTNCKLIHRIYLELNKL